MDPRVRHPAGRHGGRLPAGRQGAAGEHARRRCRCAVNHGDFRLGNTLCEGDRINAVIDWEIWSVGDPRIDLAWLTFFTDDAGHPAVAPGTVAGTPAGREIVRAYEDALGQPVPELGWFDALTRYKEAWLSPGCCSSGR